MTNYSDFMRRIKEASRNGRGFIRPPFSAAERAAISDLAIELGATAKAIDASPDHKLLPLYTSLLSALNNGRDDTSARALAERLNDRYDPAPVQPRGDAVPLPAAPITVTQVEPIAPADMETINAIVAKLVADAVASIPPRSVIVTRPDPLPPVTIEHVHPIFHRVLGWLQSKNHVYVYGPAGSGKTTLAKHCADALGVNFYTDSSVQQASDIIGYVSQIDHEYKRTGFREAFEHGGLYCLDEMDGSDPEAIVKMNMAFSSPYYPFPDKLVKRSDMFFGFGTANTVGHGANAEYVGRNQLDGASLDRFARIQMDYDETLEMDLAPDKNWARHVQKIRAICRDENIKGIISPRATIDGGRAIAMGVVSWEDAEQDRIFCGMAETEVNRIKARL